MNAEQLLHRIRGCRLLTKEAKEKNWNSSYRQLSAMLYKRYKQQYANLSLN